MMHFLLQLLGLAGTLAFVWGCVPTAWQTWRAGKSIGTPVGLAWNILIACLLFYSYTLITFGFNWIIGGCSFIEVAAYAVVLWYHYFPQPAPVKDCIHVCPRGNHDWDMCLKCGD